MSQADVRSLSLSLTCTASETVSERSVLAVSLVEHLLLLLDVDGIARFALRSRVAPRVFLRVEHAEEERND